MINLYKTFFYNHAVYKTLFACFPPALAAPRTRRLYLRCTRTRRTGSSKQTVAFIDATL